MTIETKATHTPLPWIACVNSIDGALTVEQDREALHDEEPSTVCSVDDIGDGVDRETGEANAAFIARACNSHYDLLEACEAMADYLGQQWNDDPDNEPLFVAAARAAIAKATEHSS